MPRGHSSIDSFKMQDMSDALQEIIQDIWGKNVSAPVCDLVLFFDEAWLKSRVHSISTRDLDTYLEIATLQYAMEIQES